MKRAKILAACSVLILTAARGALTEEKAKPEPKPLTPLTVQVVLTEYEGEKKLSSMPYSLPVNADDSNPSILRVGVRIPIVTQAKEGHIQYEDVGTNMDCVAQSIDGGRFKLRLGIGKSSIYMPGTEKKPEYSTPSDTPIIRRVDQSFSLLMRDGQSIQTSMATDPVSGHTLKVEVTLHVVK